MGYKIIHGINIVFPSVCLLKQQHQIQSLRSFPFDRVYYAKCS